MSTVTVTDIPLDNASPAQRLRRLAAAVRVHFTWWGVHRRLTAEQKEEVGMAYAADVRFLTAGKKLLDTRHEAFRKLTSIRNRLVSYWRGLTLPYTEPGIRLIRQSEIEPFVHTMQGFQEELTQAEADLNEVYDQIKRDARSRLGRLFDSSDYPREVRGLFAVEYDFPSIEPPSYLMGLNAELYAQEQERVSRRFEEAVQLAEQAFFAEFGKLVSHLTERLGNEVGGQPKVFRDSAIDNLTEFFERFKRLNVRSNADLDRLVEQAQSLVRGVQPQKLRDDPGLRQHVTRELTKVQSSLDSMVIDRPRRRLVRSAPSSNGVAHAVAD